MSSYNYSNSYMSINRRDEILHDYRHGVGSYQRQNNNQYNFLINNTYGISSYGQNQNVGNSRNTNGYYMSGNYL